MWTSSTAAAGANRGLPASGARRRAARAGSQPLAPRLQRRRRVLGERRPVPLAGLAEHPLDRAQATGSQAAPASRTAVTGGGTAERFTPAPRCGWR